MMDQSPMQPKEVLIPQGFFPIMNCTGKLRLTAYKNNLCLPSVMFIAAVLVGPSKELKQIFKIERNIVKKSPATGWRQTSWLLTSVAEDLNMGLPRNTSR